MSRLTLPHFGGKGHYMRCSEQFGCSGECADCEELDKIVEKLAEYEDREEKKPQTNADRIRASTDIELESLVLAFKLGYAPWCDHHCENECDDGCDNCIKEWLKKPAEEGADNG